MHSHHPKRKDFLSWISSIAKAFQGRFLLCLLQVKILPLISKMYPRCRYSSQPSWLPPHYLHSGCTREWPSKGSSLSSYKECDIHFIFKGESCPESAEGAEYFTRVVLQTHVLYVASVYAWSGNEYLAGLRQKHVE